MTLLDEAAASLPEVPTGLQPGVSRQPASWADGPASGARGDLAGVRKSTGSLGWISVTTGAAHQCPCHKPTPFGHISVTESPYGSS
jgi:hypothetical protein